jgi:hypothetical protein
MTNEPYLSYPHTRCGSMSTYSPFIFQFLTMGSQFSQQTTTTTTTTPPPVADSVEDVISQLTVRIEALENRLKEEDEDEEDEADRFMVLQVWEEGFHAGLRVYVDGNQIDPRQYHRGVVGNHISIDNPHLDVDNVLPTLLFSMLSTRRMTGTCFVPHEEFANYGFKSRGWLQQEWIDVICARRIADQEGPQEVVVSSPPEPLPTL